MDDDLKPLGPEKAKSYQQAALAAAYPKITPGVYAPLPMSNVMKCVPDCPCLECKAAKEQEQYLYKGSGGYNAYPYNELSGSIRYRAYEFLRNRINSYMSITGNYGGMDPNVLTDLIATFAESERVRLVWEHERILKDMQYEMLRLKDRMITTQKAKTKHVSSTGRKFRDDAEE